MNKSRKNISVKTPKEKVKLLALLLILIIPVSIGYWGSKNEKDQIKKHESYTIGRVIRIDDLIKRGNVVVYQFMVDDKMFKGSQNLPKGSNINVGDSIKVIFSSKNPKNNIVIFD